MSRAQPPLPLFRLFLLLPIAGLPWLAALVLQGRSPVPGLSGLVAHHWFWLLVALGLGVWAGWHEASGPDQRQEENGP